MTWRWWRTKRGARNEMAESATLVVHQAAVIAAAKTLTRCAQAYVTPSGSGLQLDMNNPGTQCAMRELIVAVIDYQEACE